MYYLDLSKILYFFFCIVSKEYLVCFELIVFIVIDERVNKSVNFWEGFYEVWVFKKMLLVGEIDIIKF